MNALNAPARMSRRKYPSPAQIAKVVHAAREAGVRVSDVEVTADGSIKVSDKASSKVGLTSDEFLQWEHRL